MAGTYNLECTTIVAGADLSALQFTAIKLGVGKVAISAASNAEPVVGILQNKPSAAGQAATVAISGIAKAKVGAGGWSSGDKLTPTTGGALVTTVNAAHHVIGIAMQDAAAGDIAELLVTPGQFGA
jgi:hypothetical protein